MNRNCELILPHVYLSSYSILPYSFCFCQRFHEKKNQSLLLLMRLSELCFVNGDIHVIFYHLNFLMSDGFYWLFVWAGLKPMWVLITD